MVNQQENKMENFFTEVLRGMSLIADTNIDTVSLIVVGHYDLPLKCALYQVGMKTGKAPDTVADLETPQVLFGLERIKDHYRVLIRKIFEQAEQQDHEALLATLRKTNQPHEMGTVSEIAIKYGISKSEVRRMKANGTLESLALLGEV
jgi:hypothetical protein